MLTLMTPMEIVPRGVILHCVVIIIHIQVASI